MASHLIPVENSHLDKGIELFHVTSLVEWAQNFLIQAYSIVRVVWGDRSQLAPIWFALVVSCQSRRKQQVSPHTACEMSPVCKLELLSTVYEVARLVIEKLRLGVVTSKLISHLNKRLNQLCSFYKWSDLTKLNSYIEAQVSCHSSLRMSQ